MSDLVHLGQRGRTAQVSDFIRYKPYLKDGRRHIQQENHDDEINYDAAEQFEYSYQQGQAAMEWNNNVPYANHELDAVKYAENDETNYVN